MAQNQIVYFGVGLTSLRGETSDQAIMDEDYGANYTLRYMVPLKDEKFVFTAETSYSNLRLQKVFGSGETAVIYENLVSHTYLGVGMRFYLTNSVNKYNPYRGQFLPFIGINIGGVNISRNSNRSVTAPTLAGKRPIADPTLGYEFYEGSNYEFTGQMEGGFVYVINKIWSVEASGIARPGFSDSWDGIEGTTDSPDWFMSGALGVQMRF